MKAPRLKSELRSQGSNLQPEMNSKGRSRFRHIWNVSTLGSARQNEEVEVG